MFGLYFHFTVSWESSQNSTWPSCGNGTATGNSEHQCPCHLPKHVKRDSGTGCWPHGALYDPHYIPCSSAKHWLCAQATMWPSSGPSVPSPLCQSWMDHPKAMTLKDKKALDCVGPRTFTSKVIRCYYIQCYYITSTQQVQKLSSP